MGSPSYLSRLSTLYRVAKRVGYPLPLVAQYIVLALSRKKAKAFYTQLPPAPQPFAGTATVGSWEWGG